jgi:hypothetical protein
LAGAEWRAKYDGPYIALGPDGEPVRSSQAVIDAKSLASLDYESGRCGRREVICASLAIGMVHLNAAEGGYALVRRRCACGNPLATRSERRIALSGCSDHAHKGRDGGECPTPGRAIDCVRCFWRCWECGAKTGVGIMALACDKCDDAHFIDCRERDEPRAVPLFRARVLGLPWIQAELGARDSFGWPLARVLWLAMAGGALPAAEAIARRFPRLFDLLAAYAMASYAMPSFYAWLVYGHDDFWSDRRE